MMIYFLCVYVKKITLNLQLINCVLCKVVEVEISTAIRFLKMHDCFRIQLFSYTENLDRIWIEYRF